MNQKPSASTNTELPFADSESAPTVLSGQLSLPLSAKADAPISPSPDAPSSASSCKVCVPESTPRCPACGRMPEVVRAPNGMFRLACPMRARRRGRKGATYHPGTGSARTLNEALNRWKSVLQRLAAGPVEPGLPSKLDGPRCSCGLRLPCYHSPMSLVGSSGAMALKEAF